MRKGSSGCDTVTYKKVDHNHAEIVAYLRRDPNVTVFSLAKIGQGKPDICVGAYGHTLLVEIKGPKGQLNDLQKAYHRHWQGRPITIIRSVEEAERLIDNIKGTL